MQSPHASRRPNDRVIAFTLVELLVAMVILAVLIAVLLPTLSKARRAAMEVRLKSELREAELRAVEPPPTATAPALPVPPVKPQATVSSFVATIGLTPRLSVGTAEPESIYEATFDASLEARRPVAQKDDVDCEIALPLPPQIVSLADLTVSVNGAPSDAIRINSDKLVWHGPLSSDAPAKVEVKYAAVGRGIYALQTPSASILDRFKIELTANESDVRMLELSMQPTSFARGPGRTTYVWDYKRLMFGRPIALDVLGIAPIDRLGELSWLGPISVVVFGLVLGLVSRAFPVANFDRWMLLLTLGTFTAAYPLMYFAQEFVPLNTAMIGASAGVIIVITIRAIAMMGWRLAIAGVAIPAALIMGLTLEAAIKPHLQGILLTALALGMFVVAMLLAPRLRSVSGAVAQIGLQPAL